MTFSTRESMKLVRAFLLLEWVLLLSDVSLGEGQEMFLDKYKDEIQEYIMTGLEKGWSNCDIMSASANTFSQEGQTKIAMDLDKIKTLNIKSSFASSSCLLVSYQVRSMASFSTLLDFGWAAIQHIRLALVVKMNSGINLDMLSNTTKLPFLIAADLEEGKEQFICPIVGEMNPKRQEKMCKLSYVSYKEKILRIALLGIPPHFIFTHDGIIEGTNIRMMRILEQKLGFTAEIIVPESFKDSIAKVCNDSYLLHK